MEQETIEVIDNEDDATDDNRLERAQRIISGTESLHHEGPASNHASKSDTVDEGADAPFPEPLQYLLDLLDQNCWDEFLKQLNHLRIEPPLSSQCQTHLERPSLSALSLSPLTLGALLSSVCCRPSTIPVSIVQHLLELNPRAALFAEEASLWTPMHLVVMSLETSIDETVDKVRRSTPPPPGTKTDQLTASQTSAAASPIAMVKCFLKHPVSMECIERRDAEGLRPIDILTQRILMKEERAKYASPHHHHHYPLHQNGRSAASSSDAAPHPSVMPPSSTFALDNHWECARLIVIAHCYLQLLHKKRRILQPNDQQPDHPVITNENTSTDYRIERNADKQGDDNPSQLDHENLFVDIPINMDSMCIVHALLYSIDADLPLALTERAIRKFHHQLAWPMAQGNLPLHWIMAQPRSRYRHATGSFSAMEEEYDESASYNTLALLEDLILKQYPFAAKICNDQNQLPLHMAWSVGRRAWDTGVWNLLQVYPQGIQHLDIVDAHFPLVYAEIEERMKQQQQQQQEEEGLNRAKASPLRALDLQFFLLRANPERASTKKSGDTHH